MNKDKIEELIAASKLNELLHKKDVEEKNKNNVVVIVFLLKLIAYQSITEKRTDDESKLPYKSTILFSKLR